MAPNSKGKSSKTVIECSTSLEGSSLILSVVKEVATSAPIAELKNAACSALLIFKTTQVIKDAYERLGYDSSRLIIAIWCSFKKAEDPEEWLSAGMRDILDDLSHILENICSFFNEHLSRSKVIRVIFRRADAVKINDFLDHLKYVTQKFVKLQSDTMSINNGLTRVPKKKKDQTSMKPQEEKRELEQPAEHVEVNHQTEDDRWLFDELEKIEEEAKDRKSELVRLRAAVHELEEANRLMKAEEEEIAQLKRELAAKVDNRQSNKIRARSSGKKSSRQEDEDEDWEGNTMVESEEERHVEMEDFQDIEDIEDDRAPLPPRRSPKGKRKRQTSSGTRPPHVDVYQGFTPVGLRSASPTFIPGMHPNRASSSSSIGPYGYRNGILGLPVVVNAGIGNINTLTISDVGNVRKFCCPRSQRRSARN